MKSTRLKISSLFILSLIVALSFVVFLSAIAVREPAPSITSQANTPKVNRIGIRTRTLDGKQEFYDTVTNKPFLFRGNNYIRMWEPKAGDLKLADFIPGQYNHEQRLTALRQMKNDGYNSVRVLIDQWEIVKEEGVLIDGYVSNLADYLKMINDHEMYAFATFRRLPEYGVYRPANPNRDLVAGPYHEEYLLQTHINAKKKYVQDVLTSLKNKGVPLEVVALWTIDNEPYFENTKPPISLKTGVFKAPNLKTYDLSSETSKNQLMDDALVYMMNEVRDAIKQVDQQALVGLGLFSPAANERPERITRPSAVINRSNADFVDVHFYPGRITYQTDRASYGIGASKKPIVVGAYGASEKFYPTPLDAARVLRDTQVSSCRAGDQAWFAYEYDTYEFDTTKWKYYHVMGHDQILNRVLAPKYRPNPCDPVKPIETVSCGSLVTSARCAPKTGTYKLAVMGLRAPAKVTFAGFNQLNGADDTVQYPATYFDNGIWMATLDASKHPGNGKMQTNIWTFDSSGNRSACTTIIMPVCQ